MRILVVGGGTGGTILANNLARRLAGEIRAGKVRLTMLTASDRHMYQPGLLYVAFGQMTPDQLYRDQASLLGRASIFTWTRSPSSTLTGTRSRPRAARPTNTMFSSSPPVHASCRRKCPA